MAARGLRKRPTHTVAVITTLSIGLGITTAVAVLLHDVVFAEIPYPDPDEIVQVVATLDDRRTVQFAPDQVRRLAEATNGLLDLSVSRFFDAALTGPEMPVRVRGVVVTGSTLPTLGERPIMGRLVGPSDDRVGGPCVVNVSHALWRDQLGGSPDALGATIHVDDVPCEVVGIMPEGFAFPRPYYAPGALWLTAGAMGVDWYERTGPGFLVFGRRAGGIGAADLAQRVASIEVAEGSEAVFAITDWAQGSRDASRGRLTILLAAAALVLLIACANVAALQLARTVDRRRELVTRRALGAGRGQIAADLLTETGILIVLGSAAALLVAWWSLDLIRALRSFSIPRMEEVQVGGAAVLICVALAALTTVVAAGAGAAGLPRGQAWSRLGQGSRGAGVGRGVRRWGRALIAVETGLALVLLAGAVLLSSSYRSLTGIDPGFDVEGLLHARVTPPPTRYPDAEARAELYAALEERFRGVAGARGVALADLPPGVGAGADQPFAVAGASPPMDGPDHAAWRSVGTNWFEALGMVLERGGGFTDPTGDARQAVVNRTFVREHFPDGGALGARIRRMSSAGYELDDEAPWTIVGVVSDVHEAYTYAPVPPTVYTHWRASPPPSVAILARTDGDPLTLSEPLRRAVSEVDPGLPVFALRDLAFILEGEYDLNRLGLALLAIFSVSALLLATAGVHGVVAHAVDRRTGEMGIRVAFGARAADVLRHVLSDCVGASVVGIALGIGAVILLGDRFAALTPGWVGLSAGAVTSAAFAVLAIAFVAGVVPARRSLRADPATVLRQD
jgi:predicted permease